VVPIVLLIPVIPVLLIVTLDHTISGRNTAFWVGGFIAVYIALISGRWLFAKRRRENALRKLPPDVIFKGEATLHPLGKTNKQVAHGDLVLDFHGFSFAPHSNRGGKALTLPWSAVSHMHLIVGRLTVTLSNGQTEVIEIPRYWGLAERLRQLPMRRS
jgi:hypothetical protein